MFSGGLDINGRSLLHHSSSVEITRFIDIYTIQTLRHNNNKDKTRDNEVYRHIHYTDIET